MLIPVPLECLIDTLGQQMIQDGVMIVIIPVVTGIKLSANSKAKVSVARAKV